MSQPHLGLLYNKEKAGLNKEKANSITEKIISVSKNSQYFEQQKKRSHNVDNTVSKMKFLLTCAREKDKRDAKREADLLINNLLQKRDMSCTYLHADLDMFFAAVEALDDPSLNDIPFAVGGDVRHGVISTSSYKARQFGVRSGMAVFIALNLCPQLKIVEHNKKKYEHYSGIVKTVFKKYDPNFISFGLDEASLNVTQLTTEIGEGFDHIMTGEEIAKNIQKEVFELTKLTLSVGVAHTRQLAKIASDINKPNGIYSLSKDPEKMQEFLNNLPIRKIPGIGGISEQILQGIGIQKVGDIFEKKVDIWLTQRPLFRVFLFSAAVGVPQKEIERGPQKSISKETTFNSTSDKGFLIGVIEDLCVKVHSLLRVQGKSCKTITVKFKDSKFNVITKAYSYEFNTNKRSDITNAALRILFDELNSHSAKYRLLGVRVSSLYDSGTKIQKSIRDFTKNGAFLPPKNKPEQSKQNPKFSLERKKPVKEESNKENPVIDDEFIKNAFRITSDDSDSDSDSGFSSYSCSLQYNYEEDAIEVVCDDDVVLPQEEKPKKEEKKKDFSLDRYFNSDKKEQITQKKKSILKKLKKKNRKRIDRTQKAIDSFFSK